MQFNSLYFILMFLPLVVAAHHLAGRSSKKAGDLLLLAASLFFYGTQNIWYLVFLAASIAVNYLLCRGIQAQKKRAGASDKKAGRGLFVLSLVCNIGFLGYFKYTNFLVENLNAIWKADIPLTSILLPVGISFYTFSEIAFAADVYRGQPWTEGISFWDCALYAAYFPKILQGPIALPRDLVPQIRDRNRKQPDPENAAIGLQMFVFGLAKKVLLADVFGQAADWGFQYLVLTTTGEMLLTMVSYTFQIYFDFSGYSDMAIGVSKLLGYELLPNFDSPYQAVSVTDFWRRWHISLTTFLREYVYFPLGGSRRGKARTYLNILLVFLVSGIWHGPNWTFVLWGVLHGLCQMAERAAGKKLLWVPTVLRRIGTFLIVSFLWLLFRSADLAEFQRVLWHLFLDRHFNFGADLLAIFRLPGIRSVLNVLPIGISDGAVNALSTVLYVGFAFVLCNAVPNTSRRTYRFGVGTLLVLAVIFYICLLSLTGVSTFVYNNF